MQFCMRKKYKLCVWNLLDARTPRHAKRILLVFVSFSSLSCVIITYYIHMYASQIIIASQLSIFLAVTHLLAFNILPTYTTDSLLRFTYISLSYLPKQNLHSHTTYPLYIPVSANSFAQLSKILRVRYLYYYVQCAQRCMYPDSDLVHACDINNTYTLYTYLIHAQND